MKIEPEVWSDKKGRGVYKYKSDLIASKVGSKFVGRVRSFTDYQKIREERDFKGNLIFDLITEEDMKWIDENTPEDEDVPC